MDARKTYRATVRLGVETDTYDRTGTAVAEADASGITREQAERALHSFEGEIEQRPPAYSALKRDGVPLYRLARSGQIVETQPRRVRVYRIEMTSWEPPLIEFEVECGKGTYVRSIAHDLGRALGVGGSLDELVRTRVGPFAIERAIDIETLRAELASGQWSETLMAMDEVLLDWPAAILGPENEQRLRNGRLAEFEELREAGERARAYSTAGDFVGIIGREAAQRWRPTKVL